MFKKPEDAKMTVEEAEKYGRELNARSAQFEQVETLSDEPVLSKDEIPPPITEEEIRRRVGDQNYKNGKDSTTMNSINS